MPGHDRTIPEFIATHPDLTDGHRMFYGLLTALMRWGFCWASNAYLSEVSGKTPRRVQQYLEKFKELNLIIVERDKQSHRLIWTKATHAEKNQHVAAWERAHPDMDFQKYFGDEMNFMGGGRNGLHPPIYKVDICSNTKNKKHIEAWAKPIPPKAPPAPSASSSSSSSDSERPRQLLQQMKGPPPTPGSKEMADETADLLQSPIKIGSQRFLMHHKDIAWFQGFSPIIVGKAIDITSQESWHGRKIEDFVPYIYKICCNLRKKQR